jgi:F-type H+-transporting ATPase subunit epsilon
MFHLQLFSLQGKQFDDKVYEATIPTIEGDIAINGGHAPLMGVASTGIISVKRKISDKPAAYDHFAVFGGTVEVLDDVARVLVDEAETADDVVESEAKKAIDRAKKQKRDARDDVSLAEAETLIDRQAVRLRLAELKRRSKKRY